MKEKAPKKEAGKHEYQRVLHAFVAECLEKPNVEGVLLVGSYAVGLQNSRSDIDVCIITTDDVPEWKRGNIIRSGFIIEYSFYPSSYLKQLEAKDFASKKRLRTRMLATGSILFDKTGLIQALQTEARKDLKEKMPPPSTQTIEFKKYYLWDQLDNLHALKEAGSPGFSYAYYAALQELVEVYAEYLQLELPRPGRMHQFITDPQFQKRYKISGLPDIEFVKLFEQAMREPVLENIRRVTELVHERMGGFTLDGWAITGTTKESN